MSEKKEWFWYERTYGPAIKEYTGYTTREDFDKAAPVEDIDWFINNQKEISFGFPLTGAIYTGRAEKSGDGYCVVSEGGLAAILEFDEDEGYWTSRSFINLAAVKVLTDSNKADKEDQNGKR